MIRVFSNKFNSIASIQLFKNFSFLLFANGINFILPIIIIPYLVKTIGISNVGKTAMAQAFMVLMVSITDYSFNISGVKDVSLQRDNLLGLQNIFNIIFGSKIILLVATFLIMVLSVEFYPKFRQDRMLFYLSFGMVLGRTILPIWFFQGIEKMQFIAYFNFASKLILTASILLLVKKKTDYFYVNFLYGVGDIISGIASLLFLSYFHKIKIRRIPYQNYIAEIKTGFGLFSTNIAISLGNSINILILSSFVSSNIVGMYSVAEKVMLMSKQFIGMLSQAIFPHVCKIAEESEKKLINFMKLELSVYFFFFTLVGVFMFLSADKITYFFTKNIVVETTRYIKYFSVVPLVVAMNMPIFQYLVIRNYQKAYVSLLLSTTLFCILSNFLLAPKYGSNGTIISIIVMEIMVTSGLYIIFISKYKKLSHYAYEKT